MTTPSKPPSNVLAVSKATTLDAKAGKLSPVQLAKLYRGQCPLCDAERFALGPRGGASRNVHCEACGAWFNRIAEEYVGHFGGDVPPFGELLSGPREGGH